MFKFPRLCQRCLFAIRRVFTKFTGLRFLQLRHFIGFAFWMACMGHRHRKCILPLLKSSSCVLDTK